MGYIDDIDTNSPLASDDPGDFPAEMRAFKGHIKSSFPNVSGEVSATEAELNILDGVTATTAELNILDGVTSTAAELNILDGVTSTAAELNILDGVTATASELNLLAGAASLGKIRDVAFSVDATEDTCATSYSTGGTVTLSDIQSGSAVLLIAVAKMYGQGAAGRVYNDITNSSNTSLMASAEAMTDYVHNGETAMVTSMAYTASPGTGSVEFRFRHKAESTNQQLTYLAFLAVEIGA